MSRSVHERWDRIFLFAAMATFWMSAGLSIGIDFAFEKLLHRSIPWEWHGLLFLMSVFPQIFAGQLLFLSALELPIANKHWCSPFIQLFYFVSIGVFSLLLRHEISSLLCLHE